MRLHYYRHNAKDNANAVNGPNVSHTLRFTFNVWSVTLQPTGSGGLSSYDSSGKDGGKFPRDKMGTNAQQTRRGIQTHPDGE